MMQNERRFPPNRHSRESGSPGSTLAHAAPDAGEHFTLEAHPRAATLYVTGAASVPGLLRALRRCEGLAGTVWLLRVDLSAAQPLDQGTLGVLWHSLSRWREARGGATQIAAPGDTHYAVTQALQTPCRSMTRRSHLARMLTQRR